MKIKKGSSSLTAGTFVVDKVDAEHAGTAATKNLVKAWCQRVAVPLPVSFVLESSPADVFENQTWLVVKYQILWFLSKVVYRWWSIWQVSKDCFKQLLLWCTYVVDLLIDFSIWRNGPPQIGEPMNCLQLSNANVNTKRVVLFSMCRLVYFCRLWTNV